MCDMFTRIAKLHSFCNTEKKHLTLLEQIKHQVEHNTHILNQIIAAKHIEDVGDPEDLPDLPLKTLEYLNSFETFFQSVQKNALMV